MVQSKIREQIQAEINAKNRIKKKQSDKRLKGLTGTCFENRFDGSGPFGGPSTGTTGTGGPLDSTGGFQSSSEMQNPSITNPFSNDFIISEISDKDIQNVLGENVFPGNVKHEGEVSASYSQPSQQSSVLSSTNSLQPGLQSSNSEDYATMYNNYYNHQIQQIYNNAANYNTSATGGGDAWTPSVQSAGSVRGPGSNGPVPGSYFGSSNSQNFQPSSQLHDFLSNQYS